MLDVEYAVRGPIAQRALEMKKQGQEVISCNIGNPQALGQPPLTYFRTILSLIENPALIARERKIRQLIGNAGSGLKEEDLIQEDVLIACERILSTSKLEQELILKARVLSLYVRRLPHLSINGIVSIQKAESLPIRKIYF